MYVLACSEPLIGNSVPLQQGVLCEQLEGALGPSGVEQSFRIRSQRGVIGRHNYMHSVAIRFGWLVNLNLWRNNVNLVGVRFPVCVELACGERDREYRQRQQTWHKLSDLLPQSRNLHIRLIVQSKLSLCESFCVRVGLGMNSNLSRLEPRPHPEMARTGLQQLPVRMQCRRSNGRKWMARWRAGQINREKKIQDERKKNLITVN